jgi:serine/threonine protein kinase
LADFGLSSEATSRVLHSTTEAKGTAGYRAPELLGSHVYNNKADIWSLGCILYELTVGQKAFKDDFVMHEYKTSGDVLTVILDEDIGDEYKESIIRNILIMLQIDYSLRPSAADLLIEFSSIFQSIQVESSDTVQIHEILPGDI